MKIAFTGHRPQKLGGFDDTTNKCTVVKAAIMSHLQPLLNTNIEIISGMALGVDTWAAELAIANNIPFYAFVPFKGQERAWPAESQTKYNYLLSKAIAIDIICIGGYTAYKMQLRNEAMVNACDILIAVWDGTSGGTANCVRYAQSKNKTIYYIRP